MFLIYTDEDGWSLRDKLQTDDFYVAHAELSLFPRDAFPDLDTFILPIEGGCKIWLGGSQYRTRPNCIPYYLNKYLSGYPRQISARQLLIARHLNTNFLTMARFRIGMTCTTPACVEISHMIPYAYYPRTKKGKIRSDAVDIVAPVAQEMSEEQKELIRKRVMGAVYTPTTSPDDILKKAFGEKPATIEERLKGWTQPKTAEPDETTLDDIGIPTTNPHK